MLRSFVLLSLSMAMLCGNSSCKKEKGTVQLTVSAKYGNEAFLLNVPNTDPEGRRVQTDVLKFYLSRIKLIKEDNSTLEVEDAALIDFSDPNSLKLDFKNVEGSFKGISLGIGLDAELNNTDPNTKDDSDPLSNNQGMYWSWMKYIFVKYEARADISGTGTGAFNWFPLYHTGSDTLYRTIQFNRTITASEESPEQLKLVLDVKKIFYNGSNTLDIETESTSQVSDNPAVALKFTNQFAQAFNLE